MHFTVIGTGIVGIGRAAWLQRDGHRVTLVSHLAPGEACSYGHAGSMSHSACLPVGLPGMWKQLPKWLLQADGPLAIRPTYLPALGPWQWRFLHHSSRVEVVRIATALRGLLSPIFDCYAPLLERAQAQHWVRRTGCLYVCSGAGAARRWAWGMNLRRQLGVDLRDVGQDELEALEPDQKGRFRFGILAPENGSTLYPSQPVTALHAQCAADGATTLSGTVIGFEHRGDRIAAVGLADGRRVEADGVVVAGGAWSGGLARALGLRVPLETQRGCHVAVQSSQLALRHTVMAPECKLMVNPMAMGLRLARTVEFAGLERPPNLARAAGPPAVFPGGPVLTAWEALRHAYPGACPQTRGFSPSPLAGEGLGRGGMTEALAIAPSPPAPPPPGAMLRTLRFTPCRPPSDEA